METAEQIADRLTKDGMRVRVSRDTDLVELWLDDGEPLEHTIEEFEDLWNELYPLEDEVIIED